MKPRYHPEKKGKKGSGSLKMILSVTASMCGSSILTLPYGFYLAGLIGGPLLSLVAMLLMGLTDSWILKSQHICRKHNANLKAKNKELEDGKAKLTRIEHSEAPSQSTSVYSSTANLLSHDHPEHSQYLVSTAKTIRSRGNSKNRKNSVAANFNVSIYNNNNDMKIIQKAGSINSDTDLLPSIATNTATTNVSENESILDINKHISPTVGSKLGSNDNSNIYSKLDEVTDEKISNNKLNNKENIFIDLNSRSTDKFDPIDRPESLGIIHEENITNDNINESKINIDDDEDYIPENLKFNEEDFPIKEQIPITDFSTITQTLTNTVFGYILSVASFVIMFAVCTSYSIFLIDMVTGIICNFTAGDLPFQKEGDPFSWCPVESLTEITYMRFVVAAFFAIILYGLASIINMGTIIKISSFGFIAFVILIIYMIVVAATDAPNGDWKDVVWKQELFKPNALKFLGISMLNFSVHNSICNVMANHPTKKNIVRDQWISYVLAWLVAVIVGMVGYITFIAYKGGVPQNFSSVLPYNAFGIIVRIFLCLDLIVVYPVIQKVLRTSISLWIPAKCKKEYYKHCCAKKSSFIPYDSNKRGINLILNLIVILITFPVAIFYPNVGSVLGVAGAIGGGIYCLLAPTLIWRIIRIIMRKWKKGLITVIVLIIIFGCTAIAMQFVTL